MAKRLNPFYTLTKIDHAMIELEAIVSGLRRDNALSAAREAAPRLAHLTKYGRVVEAQEYKHRLVNTLRGQLCLRLK